MSMSNPISQEQQRLVDEFYGSSPTKILLNKEERNALWKQFMRERDPARLATFQQSCPALYAEAEKAVRNSKNIQSAVFSECIYAQALANQYGLSEFSDASTASVWLPPQFG